MFTMDDLGLDGELTEGISPFIDDLATESIGGLEDEREVLGPHSDARARDPTWLVEVVALRLRDDLAHAIRKSFDREGSVPSHESSQRTGSVRDGEPDASVLGGLTIGPVHGARDDAVMDRIQGVLDVPARLAFLHQVQVVPQARVPLRRDAERDPSGWNPLDVEGALRGRHAPGLAGVGAQVAASRS